MIDVSAVTKRYGAFEAVKGVSFQVNPKEIVGLLGPNGAGKTTLMRILTCFHFPSDGRVTINDYDVYTDPVAIKSLIGYLPESSPVYGELSVSEYLHFVADAREIPKEEVEERICETVETCGLGSVINRPIEQLSKGYKQRVGLAQAIIHDPDILILDEPTTGLDPNQIAEIRRLIRRLGSEKTVILSTHILQEVEAVCDKVLILNEGQIVATGTTEEIAAGIKGEETFPVIFRSRKSDASSLEKSLGNITGIAGVQDLQKDESGEDLWRAVLVFDAPAELPFGNSEKIFRWAVDNKATLLELRRESFSLEDVFATLTTSGASSGGNDA